MSDRYREKPRIVSAWQFDTGNYPMPTWLRGVTSKLPDGRLVVEGRSLLTVANPGDYVIRWPDGRITACGAEVFEGMFEPVDEAE